MMSTCGAPVIAWTCSTNQRELAGRRGGAAERPVLEADDRPEARAREPERERDEVRAVHRVAVEHDDRPRALRGATRAAARSRPVAAAETATAMPHSASAARTRPTCARWYARNACGTSG